MLPHAEPEFAEKPSLPFRDISRAAAFVALGLLLPPVFHAVRLGSVFLPMVLPVVLGGFFLRPRWALVVGALTPLLSAVTTGMPPFLPPIALWMAGELAVMCVVVSLLDTKTRLPPLASLAIALLAGRALYTGMVFATSTWMQLPPRLLTLAAVASSWPGMVLALAVVPAAVAALRRSSASRLGTALSTTESS